VTGHMARGVISLGRRLPDALCSLPGARMRRATARSCLALLLMGFVVPLPLPASAVGSYPTFSPLPVQPKPPSAV